LIRFGGYQPPASVHNRAGEVLGAALTSRLGDAIGFELEGNVIDAGHKAADLLAMVERGDKTMCYFAASYLAERVPEIAVLDLPFMVTSRARAYAALDGALGQRLAERVAAVTGYRVLAYWDNGFRHLSNRVRPIRAPEDCRGLRIRTLSSALHSETFRRLGFEPETMDVKELLAAVRAGTIDAQDNPLTNIYNFGIHQFHPHITLTAHFFGVAALLCHKASHDAWPGEVRRAVMDAVAEATAAQREFAAAEDVRVREALRATDTEVIELSEAERAEFRAAVAPVVAAHGARLGADWLDALAN
jgi:C4-dicarboxylate-binding protein DctP